MTVFAINFSARTARVFPTYAEAVNGANVGEQVVANAAAIERQHIYGVGELADFYRSLPGANPNVEFGAVETLSAAIFGHLRSLAPAGSESGVLFVRGAPAADPGADAGDWLIPESQHDSNGGAVLPHRALPPETRPGAWQDVPAQGLFGAVKTEPSEPDPAAELAERLAANAVAIVAHVRGIAAKIAHYRELAARPGADQHEELRVAAAERELSKLLSRLADNGAADMERARFAAEGVAFLETVAPGVLARHADPQPKPEPKPYQGRKEGETRGRRGKMEGKRFTALRKMNLFGNGTRRRAAYQLILDNPGATYERLVEAGAYPADLAIFLRDGVARMED